MEALVAAAASPEPAPINDLRPDPLLRDELPEDLPWLVRLLPRADVYLQDEVGVWLRVGGLARRLVRLAARPGRRAVPVCAQLRRAVERSQARGRIAVMLLDNLGIHTPKGSLLLRVLLEECRGQLVLVYTPPYDPEAIASNGCGEGGGGTGLALRTRQWKSTAHAS